MPFVHNDGIDIYYEIHGEGEPLVLLHGFVASSLQWHRWDYVDELKRSHQLVLIDLRGHGRSEKPHTHDEYTLEKRLADICAVLNALAIERAHFMGYSMGGWLAYGMAVRHGEMVASLMIGGAHPYAESFQSFDGVDGRDADVFVAALEKFSGERISSQFKPVILQNDLVALAAAATDRDGFGSDLHRITQPLLLFAGELDQRLEQIQRAAKVLDCHDLLIVPGANHAGALTGGKILLPSMKKFLGSIHM
jgi:pimeloyl-ACP methyl ester carboxylesterase